MKKLAFFCSILVIFSYSRFAIAKSITIDGTIIVGSSIGTVSGKSEEYTYGRTTKNVGALNKACPTVMGSEVRCIVVFEETNGSITKIISARRPTSSDPTDPPITISQKSENPLPSRKLAWKDAFSRRSYQLGMRISEFKSTPYPDQKEWPKAYPVCSNEPAQLAKLSPLEAPDLSNFSFENIGAIKCLFFYPGSMGTTAAGLMLGDVSPFYNEFLFLKPADSSEPVLFLINAQFPVNRFTSVFEKLQSYYGDPTSKSTVDLTTGVGIQLKGQVISFVNSSSQIIVSQYSSDIRRGSIVYSLNEVFDQASEANKRKTQRSGPP